MSAAGRSQDRTYIVVRRDYIDNLHPGSEQQDPQLPRFAAASAAGNDTHIRAWSGVCLFFPTLSTRRIRNHSQRSSRSVPRVGEVPRRHYHAPRWRSCWSARLTPVPRPPVWDGRGGWLSRAAQLRYFGDRPPASPGPAPAGAQHCTCGRCPTSSTRRPLRAPLTRILCDEAAAGVPGVRREPVAPR